jgi:hypothetical protein
MLNSSKLKNKNLCEGLLSVMASSPAGAPEQRKQATPSILRKQDGRRIDTMNKSPVEPEETC